MTSGSMDACLLDHASCVVSGCVTALLMGRWDKPEVSCGFKLSEPE